MARVAWSALLDPLAHRRRAVPLGDHVFDIRDQAGLDAETRRHECEGFWDTFGPLFQMPPPIEQQVLSDLVFDVPTEEITRRLMKFFHIGRGAARGAIARTRAALRKALAKDWGPEREP